jgi:hypothetical protein
VSAAPWQNAGPWRLRADRRLRHTGRSRPLRAGVLRGGGDRNRCLTVTDPCGLVRDRGTAADATTSVGSFGGAHLRSLSHGDAESRAADFDSRSADPGSRTADCDPARRCAIVRAARPLTDAPAVGSTDVDANCAADDRAWPDVDADTESADPRWSERLRFAIGWERGKHA